MAETYTIQQFAAAIRKRRPDLGHIPDMTLVGKTIEAAPELKSLLGNEPSAPSDDRTAGHVALEGVGNTIVGGLKMVAGIPGMIADTAKLGYDAATGNAMGAGKRLWGMAEGAAEPMVPILDTATGGSPTPEQWKQGQQAAGANLAGLVLPGAVGKVGGKALGAVDRAATPERLMQLANDARAYREATSQQSTFPSKAGLFKSAVTGTKRAAAGVAAPLAEKAAKIRAGRPLVEGPTYAPETTNLNFPEKEPVGDIQTVAAVKPDQYTPQYTEPEPLTPNEPVNIPRPPQVDARSQEFLRRLDEPDLGAPDQYTPQYTEPEPLTPNEPVNIPRPGMSIENQDFMRSLEPQAPQFEYPIQQLLPEHDMLLQGISKGGKSVPLSNKTYGNLAMQNAPYLLEVLPELKGVPPGAGFDGRLFNGFKRIGHELKAMEASIPDNTPVATGEAVAKLEALQQEVAATQIQNKAVHTIEKIVKALKDKPTIEWKDFIEAKRGFDAEVGVDSVTGNKIYQIFKETSNKVSPELGKLNQQYYTTRTAIDLAKMNPFNGLRLAEVAEKAKGIRRNK